MAKVVCFDIDGVLTIESDTKRDDLSGTYAYRSPNKDAIATVCAAHDAGWTVVLYTGRKEGHRALTENWLFANGVPYHFLVMGKPYFRYVVDDRALSLKEFKERIGEAY